MANDGQIKEDSQNLNIDSEFIILYSIDLNPVGYNIVYYFTAGVVDGASIYFNGLEYLPFAVNAEGFEHPGEDSPFPRPVLTVSNINRALVSELRSKNDFIGAKVKRIKTYKKYLDGQPASDDIKYNSDIYFVNRRLSSTQEVVQLELINPIDNEHMKCPRLQCSETCMHRYRVLNDAGVVQNEDIVTCPYAESTYFTSIGNPTNKPEEDSCAKTVKDCRLRYDPLNEALPYLGQPNIAKVASRFVARF